MSVQAYVYRRKIEGRDGIFYEGRGGHLTDDLQMAVVSAGGPSGRMARLVACKAVELVAVRIVEMTAEEAGEQ